MVWVIQAAGSEDEFTSRLEALAVANTDIAHVLCDIPAGQWTLHVAFADVNLYGWRTTNFVESENNQALNTRHKNPFDVFQHYIANSMQAKHNRWIASEKWKIDGKVVAKYAANLLEEQSKQAGQILCRHEEEHQRFVEQRVAAAQEEANARNNVLVLAIQQTYGDPSALERRVVARIQAVLQQLQDGAQQQARAFAEAQIADQAAANQFMEHRMHAAVQQVESEANLRVGARIQDLWAGICSQQSTTTEEFKRAAEERSDISNQLQHTVEQYQLVSMWAKQSTSALIHGTLPSLVYARLEELQEATIARAEARVVELVRGGPDQHDTAIRMRQKQERVTESNHLKERLRQVTVVAKKAAESKAREMMALRARVSESARNSAPSDVPKDVDVIVSSQDEPLARV
ncbi:hypothetical protein BBJ28_00016728 [Nothophytophthora sp. Chile5]|nr:hypothetical protein BBJ28_00016728 [Nothophytophthora sp. Chile5]